MGMDVSAMVDALMDDTATGSGLSTRADATPPLGSDGTPPLPPPKKKNDRERNPQARHEQQLEIVSCARVDRRIGKPREPGARAIKSGPARHPGVVADPVEGAGPRHPTWDRLTTPITAGCAHIAVPVWKHERLAICA
jgi:hypothetical protein